MASDSNNTVSSTIASTQEGPQKAPGMEALLLNLVPFILIFVVFYFLLIRPQKKKQTEHKKMLEVLKSGDMVLLNSGIKGKVVSTKEDGYLVLEISSNVSVEVLKTAVIDILK